VLGGAPELSGPTLASYVRALLPDGAASPAASMMEYPDGDSLDVAEVNDWAGRGVLPTGDVRDDLRAVVEGATIDDLRAAWHAADDMRVWALRLCKAVEAELDSGRPGEATVEWMLGATVLGAPRLLICDVLRERCPSPANRALNAVMLLWMGMAIGRFRVGVSHAQFDLLPVIVPPFLHPLIGIAPAVPSE
jgi:hypothetical protein